MYILLVIILLLAGCDNGNQQETVPVTHQIPGAVRPVEWPVQLDGWLVDEKRWIDYENRHPEPIDDLERMAAVLAGLGVSENSAGWMRFVAIDGTHFNLEDNYPQYTGLLGQSVRIAGRVNRWGRLAIDSCGPISSQSQVK